MRAGVAHRDDGPAFTADDGRFEWRQHGHLHRTNGPALRWDDGTTFWYLEGRIHRADGPAVHRPAGGHSWWYEGTPVHDPEGALDQLPAPSAVLSAVLSLYKPGDDISALVAAVARAYTS